MKQHVIIFLSGLLFALGLGVSGMTDADKVIHFLNPFGGWDPSLMFVMVGGIAIHLLLFRLILRRPSPIYASDFRLPDAKDIDRRLVLGSLVFGAGWGLGGFCPGPGLVSAAGGGAEAITFVVAMIAGMLIFERSQRALSADAASSLAQGAS
jgi:uncharacterized membrane protein YedE/YeeE